MGTATNTARSRGVYGTFTENNQLVLDDPEERFNNDALDFIDHVPALQGDTNTIARDVLEGVLGTGVQVGGAYQAALDNNQETTELPASHHSFIDTMISFGNVAAALFRDIDLEDIKETAQVAGEVFVPGFDLYICATQGGCSAFDTWQVPTWNPYQGTTQVHLPPHRGGEETVSAPAPCAAGGVRRLPVPADRGWLAGDVAPLAPRRTFNLGVLVEHETLRGCTEGEAHWNGVSEGELLVRMAQRPTAFPGAQ
jgi:hypothetical protein